MGLVENTEVIKTQVNQMKTQLSLPVSTPLVEVTAKVQPAGDYFIKNLPEGDTSNFKSIQSWIKELPEIDVRDMSGLSETFKDCVSLTKPPKLINLDSSPSLRSTFMNCTNITEVDFNAMGFENILIGSATDTFSGCTKLTTVKNLNFKDSVDLTGLFDGCTSLVTIEPKINLGKISNNANRCFKNCSSLIEDPCTSYFKNANSAAEFFYGCSKLKSVRFFEGKYLYYAYSAFQGCSSLERVESIIFGTYIYNINDLFNGCTSLKYINFKDTDLTRASYYTNMFVGVPLDCEIIVKDEANKQFVLERQPGFTNVKVVAV